MTDATLPDQIGRYRILRELARGGIGVVYEARDLLQDRRCALKVLLAGAGADPKAVERFRREAPIGAQLGEHPAIVPVFDFGQVPGTGELYCAMEFVEGNSLGRLLKEGLERQEGQAPGPGIEQRRDHEADQQGGHAKRGPSQDLGVRIPARGSCGQTRSRAGSPRPAGTPGAPGGTNEGDAARGSRG